MTPTKFIEDVGRELRIQDNRCTSYPIFYVQQGTEIEDEDGPEFKWKDTDWLDVTPEKATELNKLYANRHDDDDPELAAYTRFSYRMDWDNIQPFLTRKTADWFIDRHGHDYDYLRVYVASGHANPEWIAIRRLLLDLTQKPEDKPVHE